MTPEEKQAKLHSAIYDFIEELEFQFPDDEFDFDEWFDMLNEQCLKKLNS